MKRYFYRKKRNAGVKKRKNQPKSSSYHSQRSSRSVDEVKTDAANLETLERSRRSVNEVQPDVSDVSNFEALDRSPRSVNEMQADVSNMEALARLTGGVSSIIGLLDDTITPEAFINDLLRMGDLKLEDIINLDQKPIEKTLNLLNQKAPVDNKMEHIEKWLIQIDQIREESEFMLTFNKFPKKSEYIQKLNEMVKLKTSMDTKIDTMKKALSNFKTSLERFENKDTLNEVDAGLLLGAQTLSDLGKLETAAKNFQKDLGPLKEVKKTEESADFYKILELEFAIRVKLGKQVALHDNTVINALTATFDDIFAARDQSKASLPVLEKVQALIQSRRPSFRHNFKNFPGLQHGYKDLEKLYSDSGNQWIMDTISENPQKVAEAFKKLFAPYKELAKELEHVETVDWKNLGDGAAVKVINTLLDMLNLAADSKTVMSNVETIKKCEFERSNPDNDISDVSTHIEKIKELNTKIKDLDLLDSSASLQDLSALRALLNTEANPADKVKAATEYRTKMKNSEEFKKVIEVVKHLETGLQDLVTAVGEIPGTAQTVINGMSQIDSYYQPIAKKQYLDFFSCIRNTVGDKSALVKNTLEAVRNARLDNTAFANGKATIIKMLDSKNGLKNAKEKVDAIMKMSTPEATALKPAFGDKYMDTSKAIGLGVQGLNAILKAHESQKSLDPLLTNIPQIQKDASTVGLSNEQKTAIQGLGSLHNVFKDIDNFVNKPIGKAARMKRNVNFDDSKKIFDEAQLLKGVQIDMKHLRGAMEALNANGKYKAVLPMLDILEQLNLDFASFNFQNAGNQLAPTGVFFTSYGKGIVALSPPPQTISNTVPGAGQPLNSLSVLLTTTVAAVTKSAFQTYGIPALCIVGGCTAIGIVSYIVVDQVKKRKKNKQGPPPDPPIPVSPDPPVPVDPVAVNPAPVNPAPVVAAPVDAAHVDAAPVDQASADAAPVDAAPVDQAPADAAPVDAAPVDQVPVVSVPEKKLTEEQPKPVIVELSNEDALFLVHSCVLAIRSKATQNVSPFDWLNAMFNGMNIVDNAMIDHNAHKVNMKERRYENIICLPETMSKITGFDSNFIHSNVIQIGEYFWHIAQGPLDGTEGAGALDTREKMYALIEQNTIGLVVQLCNYVETGRSKIAKIKCSQYYPLELNEVIKYGMYTVETIKIQPKFDYFSEVNDIEGRAGFTLYTLKYTNTKTKVENTVDVLFYSGWTDFGTPSTPIVALEVVNYIDSRKCNVVVHCSAGVGRSGTIAAIKYGLELLILAIRSVRSGAIQTKDQLLYTILCITKGIMDKRGLSYWEDYYFLMHFYKGIQVEIAAREVEQYRVQDLRRENARRKAENKEGKKEHQPLLKIEPREEPEFNWEKEETEANDYCKRMKAECDAKDAEKKKKKEEEEEEEKKKKEEDDEKKMKKEEEPEKKKKTASVKNTPGETKSKTKSTKKKSTDSRKSNPKSAKPSGDQKNKKNGSVEKSSSEKGKGKKASAEQKVEKGAKKSSVSSVSKSTSAKNKKKASGKKSKGKKVSKETPKKGVKKTK